MVASFGYALTLAGALLNKYKAIRYVLDELPQRIIYDRRASCKIQITMLTSF